MLSIVQSSLVVTADEQTEANLGGGGLAQS